MTTALEGAVAIEVSGHVAGPYAGSLLGDLGCEVIKVELPGEGDTHRGRNPQYEGYGPSFRALNRNKKSLTLNLKEQEGREILLRLLEKAGVFRSTFRLNNEMAFLEGMRNMGIILMADIHELCPEKYHVMVKEAEDNAKRSSDGRQ